MRPAVPSPRGGIWAAGAAALAGVLALAGCGGNDGGKSDAGAKPRLSVGGAFMPQPVTAAMAAGFLTVTNEGGADTLTSVSSELSDSVTLHTTDGGSMKEKDSFTVPAHGRLDFGRGGNHLMFGKLARLPRQGDTVRITLHFERSGAVRVAVPVKSATYQPGRPSRPTSP
ncbi:copper chaperone PCu(A)C [Streptomyces sp. NPDC058045]|uniref:copper chaperone PCu(A)C n=1 Tax=Streptomyces sp. NPDC058045 TaxID=3346311 RepID=UPI0036EF5785